MLTMCSNVPRPEVTFVGDSLVEGWNTRYWIPGYDTHNDGLSGARIDYLESLAGRYVGKELVVLIGTNNYFELDTPESRAAFAERYLNAVHHLGASRVVLISLLPRDPSTIYDPTIDVNANIRAFNTLIAAAAAADESTTFLDCHDIFLTGNDINHTLYLDGLHLNDNGYRLLSQAVNKCLNIVSNSQ